MAQFFAEIKGARSVVSSLGNKQSGMTVSCKSYAGEVNVHMWYDKANASDWVTVTLGAHGGGRSITLYHGPCDQWNKNVWPKELVA